MEFNPNDYVMKSFSMYYPTTFEKAVDYEYRDGFLFVRTTDDETYMYDILTEDLYLREDYLERGSRTDDEWKEEFGKRLRMMVNHRNRSQKSLAEEIGITPASLNLYLRGRRLPNPRTLSKLARALKCSVSVLIDFD